MSIKELNSEETLKPCPFCQSTASLYYQLDDLDDYLVMCNNCGATTCPEGIRYNRTEAIADWNKRIQVFST